MVVDGVEQLVRVGASPGDLAIEHAPLLVDDVDRVERQLGRVGVHQAVATDDDLVRVAREIEGEVLGVGPRDRVGGRIDADGDQLDAAIDEGLMVVAQIPELRIAGGSPEAAVEDDHDRAARARLRE